jgi:serine/threonine-protein kinase
MKTGTRLGAYEVISSLGAGGMGEVYRARDTKLGRDVAIKILSDGFAHDPERLARFHREAHLLASLNHPRIAAIYGLEEANGSQFLVLELVEGETLAERLKSGPLPVPEALNVARQIADALQAAHEKGIIHRDLKPANIAFTADGQVKVLDFGLAKELETVPTDLTNSPTMTLGATQAGVILGTAAYMAPEQVKGRAADKRSDVWAFGCVLYEMLTGKRAFVGEDVNETLAAVLLAEPKWTALPNNLSPAVQTLVRHCLQKDPKERIRDISVAQFVMANPGVFLASAEAPAPRLVPLWRRLAIFSAPALVAGITIAGATARLTTGTSPSPRVSRFLVTPPSAAAPTLDQFNRQLAITPDGTSIVFTGGNDRSGLFVRPLDQLDLRPLSGLGLALRPFAPFVSPDGQWVGFFSGGGLKKIAITGSPPVSLFTVDGVRGVGTWGPDHTIVFATNNLETGLQQVTEDGGEPTVLTRPDHGRGEADHLWPEFLPGGRAVLFTITSTTGGLDQAQIAVLDLGTGMHNVLIRGATDARYVPSGHLLYGAGGALWAVAFDVARLSVVGTPLQVVPQIVTNSDGGLAAAVASDGTLVFIPGTGARTLVWVDRDGRETPIPAPPRMWAHPRISPDGSRIALITQEGDADIWVLDPVHGGLTRVTSDPIGDIYPVWAPDGSRIFFSSPRGGPRNLFSRAADGTGDDRRLTESSTNQDPNAISPDGRQLVFAGNNDVMLLELDTTQITPLVETSFNESNAAISPDGRWLAYQANDTGTVEIYVRPFPNVGGRWLASAGGGTQPLWARDSQELIYRAPTGAVMRVGVADGSTWNGTMPTEVFAGRYVVGTGGRNYDISLDGRQFLMVKEDVGSESTATSTSLVVVQHFDEELKRLVPAR